MSGILKICQYSGIMEEIIILADSITMTEYRKGVKLDILLLNGTKISLGGASLSIGFRESEENKISKELEQAYIATQNALTGKGMEVTLYSTPVTISSQQDELKRLTYYLKEISESKQTKTSKR